MLKADAVTKDTKMFKQFFKIGILITHLVFYIYLELMICFVKLRNGNRDHGCKGRIKGSRYDQKVIEQWQRIIVGVGDQDLNAFMKQVGVEDLRQDVNRLKAFIFRHLNSILYTEKCVHEINGSYTYIF